MARSCPGRWNTVTSGGNIRVAVENGWVVVEDAPSIPRLDLFFQVVLSGRRSDGAWRCPARIAPVADLVVRIVRQLEKEGFEVDLVGEADTAVQAAVERARSFGRVRDSGRRLRDGDSVVPIASIEASLARAGWDSAKRNLHPHQREALHHALTVINAANFSVPGAGKTAATLAALAVHLDNDTVDVALVVGPLSSFAPWEKEAAAALSGHIRVRRVRGDRAARRRLYDETHRGDVLLVTYPTVPADIRELRALGERFRVLLVVDESHRVKRFRGGLWATSILELSTRCRVRLILTGTPMPQGPEDLYSQLNILWPDQQLTGSRVQFQSRATTQFAALVDDISPFFVRTPKDALGIPPYTVVLHEVDMAPLQAEIFDLIVARFRRTLTDAPLWQQKIDSLRKGRPIRLIQAASNPDLLNQADGFFHLPPIDRPGGTLLARLNEYRKRELPAKFTLALDIVRQQVDRGLKTVVWTSFIRNIDQFGNLVQRQLGIPVWSVDGRVPAAVDTGLDPLSPDDPQEEIDVTREQRIRSFLASESPGVLVANPAACGESISLHETCRTAVYLDRTYDCARYLQSVDRIHRLGLPFDAIVEIHILEATRGSTPAVDALVRVSLERKQARMESLLRGAELVPALLAPEDDLGAAQGDDRDLEELLAYLLGE
jgi:hypothetical protein